MPPGHHIETIDHPGIRERADRLWNQIRDHLEDKRARLGREIRDYPQPIPACDAQFNHLTDKRSAIYGELRRLELARVDGFAQRDRLKAIDEFIASSDCVDEQAKRVFRADLREAVSPPDA